MNEQSYECRHVFFSRLAELVQGDQQFPWASAPGMAPTGDLSVANTEWRREVAAGYDNGLLLYVFTNFSKSSPDGVFGTLISLGRQRSSSSSVKFRDEMMKVVEHKEVIRKADAIMGVTPERMWDSNNRGRSWVEFVRPSIGNAHWRLNADVAYELLRRMRELWDQLLRDAAEATAKGKAAEDVIAGLVNRKVAANPRIHSFERKLRE